MYKIYRDLSRFIKIYQDLSKQSSQVSEISLLIILAIMAEFVGAMLLLPKLKTPGGKRNPRVSPYISHYAT